MDSVQPEDLERLYERYENRTTVNSDLIYQDLRGGNQKPSSKLKNFAEYLTIPHILRKNIEDSKNLSELNEYKDDIDNYSDTPKIQGSLTKNFNFKENELVFDYKNKIDSSTNKDYLDSLKPEIGGYSSLEKQISLKKAEFTREETKERVQQKFLTQETKEKVLEYPFKSVNKIAEKYRVSGDEAEQRLRDLGFEIKEGRYGKEIVR